MDFHVNNDIPYIVDVVNVNDVCFYFFEFNCISKMHKTFEGQETRTHIKFVCCALIED